MSIFSIFREFPEYYRFNDSLDEMANLNDDYIKQIYQSFSTPLQMWYNSMFSNSIELLEQIREAIDATNNDTQTSKPSSTIDSELMESRNQYLKFKHQKGLIHKELMQTRKKIDKVNKVISQSSKEKSKYYKELQSLRDN